MKIFRRISALMLALLLALGLCACGEEKEPTLEGRWKTSLNIGDALTAFVLENINMETKSTEKLKNTKLELYVNLELNDGKYTLSLDKEASQKSMDAYFEVVRKVGVNYVYMLGADQGLFIEDVDALVMDTYHMDVPSYVDKMFEENLGSIDFLSFMKDETGLYKEEGGKLYFGKDSKELESREKSMDFRLDGDSLILDKPQGIMLSEDVPGIKLPMVWSR